MKNSDLNRRDFNRLSMAAFSGIVAGSLAGCSKAPAPATGGEGESAAGSAATEENVSLLLQEPHVCRGLNTCKTDKNDCAGMGSCASVDKHECAGTNACKGQGGCGENPGENTCKGKGHCSIPLMDHAWKSARKNFEDAMKNAGKTFGEAPERS